MLRISGKMTPYECPLLTPEHTQEITTSILPSHMLERLEREGGADFAIPFGDSARFRVSILKAKGNYGLVLRLIPSRLLPMDQIGLPPAIQALLKRPRGLILVTGPTGSGKSTTLASMVNWINENRQSHIITIEDPIEYYHPHKQSVVTQREVHVDVTSFAEAIRGALRQDPDVILVGEMRDLETIEAAVTAAAQGAARVSWRSSGGAVARARRNHGTDAHAKLHSVRNLGRHCRHRRSQRQPRDYDSNPTATADQLQPPRPRHRRRPPPAKSFGHYGHWRAARALDGTSHGWHPHRSLHTCREQRRGHVALVDPRVHIQR